VFKIYTIYTAHTYKKNILYTYTPPLPPPSHALRAYPSTTGLWVHKRCASPHDHFLRVLRNVRMYIIRIPHVCTYYIIICRAVRYTNIRSLFLFHSSSPIVVYIYYIGVRVLCIFTHILCHYGGHSAIVDKFLYDP